MMQQNLPNSTLVLVFGILSVLLCCCYGIGIIFAIIALVMASKAMTLYYQDPTLYTGFQNLRIGRVLAIIGLILNLIFIGYLIYIFSMFSLEEIMQMNEELRREYGL